MSAIMGRLPILLRLVLLAGALLIILAGSNAFLVREISRHVELMAENARLISALEAASAAQGAFGDMKYGWSDRESGDRSGGRLLESQRRAHAVRTRLEQQLERLEALEPEGVERIRQQLAKTLELTSAALHAYGNRQENHGAALMVKIRGSAAIVDQRLLDLVAGLEARAASEALRNLRRSRQTIEFAFLVVGLAIVFGVSVTLFVVHSIRRSLAQRDRFDADRRAAEEALRNSEKRFRDIADVASDWFWEMDEALRFSYVSKRVGEIAGINPGEILGKTRPELAGAELDEAAWQHHRSDLEAHRPFRDFHYCKTLGDGRVKH